MADKRITDLTTITEIDPSNDLLEIVDVSEPNVSLKNKKATPQQIIGAAKIDQLGEPTDNTNLDVNTSRHGLMKKLSGIATQFFNGLGQWIQVKDTDLNLQDETTSNTTISRHGFMPKLSGVSTQFINGLGQWATPPGSGGGVNKLTPSTFFPLYAQPVKMTTNLNTANYDFAGFIACNPKNGHIVTIYRKGSTHAGSKGLGYIRHSYNGGVNFGNEISIIGDDNYDVRNFAGGYDSNGRLHVFYGTYNHNTSTWISLNYMRSDDDGLNWSGFLTLNVDSNPTYSPHGQLIELPNGTLLQGWYAINGSTWKTYLYKSTNNGLSWSVISVYSGSVKTTEPTLLHLGASFVLCVTRINEGSAYRQFISGDLGETWTDQGSTSFESWAYNPADSIYEPSPCLFRFVYNGALVCGLYFARRDLTPNVQKVIYGLPKNLIDNGVSGWNASTIKTVYTFAGNRLCGMPTAIHNENFYGIINLFDHQSSTDADLVIVPSPPQNLQGIMNTLGV